MHTLAEMSGERRAQLQHFLDSVAAADGKPPLTEYKQFRTGTGEGTMERLALTDGGTIAGYVQAAWHRPVTESDGHWGIEVAVAPEYREGSTIDDLIAVINQDVGADAATLWAHDRYVVAAADRGGWSPGRVLLKMMRELPFECPHEIPAGLTIAPFRPGVDEAAWLTANNVAFRGHPENGALTIEDLAKRKAQVWFDPDGFLLAWDGPTIAGSCWTKMHEGGVGEIYIIGIVPGYAGRGLGTALVCLGLDYMSRAHGATHGMLYVEASNPRATRLYERLGFDVAARIVAYTNNR
jgi:mycothiol synthase